LILSAAAKHYKQIQNVLATSCNIFPLVRNLSYTSRRKAFPTARWLLN